MENARMRSLSWDQVLAWRLRVAGATRQDVRQELWERRGLVKTYGLRGTVHLFPAFGGAWPRWWTAIGEAAVRGAYPRDQVIPPAAAARAAEGAPARTASSARSSRHRSPSPSARSN